MKTATIGKNVLYQFDEHMAQRVNEMRLSGNDYLRHPGFYRTQVLAGQMCAAIITGVQGSGFHVNLKLVLDAPFDLWIEFVEFGEGCNKWRWPLE